MELDVLRSGRHVLAQRTVIVLNATIQHLHHLEVRLNAVVNVDAASNNRHRLFDYDQQLRRGEGVGGTGRGGSVPRGSGRKYFVATHCRSASNVQASLSF